MFSCLHSWYGGYQVATVEGARYDGGYQVASRPEEGFETVHDLAEAQTDLATVRDAMEATDEALARKEQEAAYMVDGEM